MHPIGQLIFKQMFDEQKYADDNTDKNVTYQKSNHKFSHINFLLLLFFG